jgi:hypothetical protein
VTSPLFGWTIYERPRDHPGGYVVRRWEIRDGDVIPDATARYAPTLAHARSLVPPGLALVRREPDDDPAVLETWL